MSEITVDGWWYMDGTHRERGFAMKEGTVSPRLRLKVHMLLIAIIVCSNLISCARSGPARPTDRYHLLPASSDSRGKVTGTLKANFIGVHDGEACLIDLPDGTTMMVDTGAYAVGPELATIVKNMGITRIDHLVVTNIGDGHHAAGLIPIINTFEIGAFYMAPRGRESVNATVSGAIDLIENKGVPIVEAGQGVVILDHQNLRASFLGPVDLEYESSSPFALTYGEHTFFFADDADSKAEKELVEAEGTPDVTILSVGNTHEGSVGAEKVAALVEKCYPEIAVIYGDVAMSRIKDLNTDFVNPNDMALTAPPVTQQFVWVISTDGEELTTGKRYVDLK